MNIHLMIILLGFVAPVHKDMPLIEAPQVVAPASIEEYRAILKQVEELRRENDGE